MHSSQDTSTNRMHLRKSRWQSGGWLRGNALFGTLGRQLATQIILASAILSLIATSVQLFATYKKDREDLHNVTTVVEQTLSTAFEDALWEYNFQLAEALLEGVYNKPSVEYAKITTAEKRTIELGQPEAGLIFEDLRLEHVERGGRAVYVGVLTVGLSTDHANAHLISQAWVLSLSNFAKALIASVIMLAIFEQYVGRHLRRLAKHVSRSTWNLAEEKIVLDRPPRNETDDLDHIVDAIETAAHRSKADFSRLEHEICQRLETEIQLKERTRSLENANREQAEFTYAISHDLKSPTNTVKMLIGELMLLEQDRISEEGQRIITDMDHTANRMAQLIEDVLKYASAVEAETKVERVDLNEMIREVCDDLQSDILDSNADVRYGDLPVINGDKGQLRILLQNLVGNAIKFRAPDQSPIVTVKAGKLNGCHILRVCDNGIGIAPEYRERVFGLFQRLHSHRTYQGSGLGLALCKRIVTNHSGHIKVQSAMRRGTCFEITIRKRSDGI